MRGDIETPFADRAKEYSWNFCLRLAPRKITPTDIDYAIEANGRFVFFEMKTLGSQMKYGQERLFTELLAAIGINAMLFIVEHPPLNRAVMPFVVERFQVWKWNPLTKMIDRSNVFDGTRFAAAYKACFDWADGNIEPLRSVLRKNFS